MSKIDKFGHRTSGKTSTKGSSGCVLCSLENAIKKLLPKSEGFSLKVWKGQENFFSIKLCFPRKIIFVFVECKIGKHAKIIMPTVQKLLLQVREKWKKKALIDKGFFTKRPSGMIESSLDKRPIFFTKSLEVTKWVIELQKKVPKSVPLDSQYNVMRTQIKIMAIVRTLIARSLKNKREVFKRHCSPQNDPPGTTNGYLVTLLTF